MSTEKLRWLYGNWKAVYRHNDGLGGLARCLYGTLKLKTGLLNVEERTAAKVDCVTFSVVPKMTLLWAFFMEHAIDRTPRRILIGDCSGALGTMRDAGRSVYVTPLLNYAHGVKLDFFMNKICSAEYVVVSDDDVFWIHSQPWMWALNQLENDPDVAVVSLMPRGVVLGALIGKVEQPMGSYCLVIRRDIWLEEALSFQIIHSDQDRYNRLYDTADQANVELLRRGYKVVIAPYKIREALVAFEGISQWILKIQKYAGNIHPLIAEEQFKQEKALRAIYVADGLTDILTRYRPENGDVHIAPYDMLRKAEHVCSELMDHSKICEIHDYVACNLHRIEDTLRRQWWPVPHSSESTGVR